MQVARNTDARRALKLRPDPMFENHKKSQDTSHNLPVEQTEIEPALDGPVIPIRVGVGPFFQLHLQNQPKSPTDFPLAPSPISMQ